MKELFVNADLNNIPSQYWGLAVSHGRDADAKIDETGELNNDKHGLIAIANADIKQCITDILFTPLGSDPLRPTFGCGIHQYIDQPINHSRAFIVRDAYIALKQWEPRINVLKIDVIMDVHAQLKITINWQYADAGDDVFVTQLLVGE